MLRRVGWTMVRLTAIGASFYFFVIRPWQRRWDATPEEQARAMPGDDLVPDATVSETRVITIAARPSAIWPWLVQMGYGRAGWYSYDQLDMKGASADRIVPEWQQIAAGDVMPTHPEGGFEVSALEPERSLVLFLDTPTMEAQRQKALAEQGTPEAMPVGLGVGGRYLGAVMPDFRATWTFLLDPIDDAHTRLVERFRVTMARESLPGRIPGPLTGFGIFLMTRKQMLGIKARAERMAEEATSVPTAPAPSAA